MKLTFARLSQESNSFSPLVTTMADFEGTHLVEGESLLAACGADAREVPSWLKNAELSGFVQEIQRCGDPSVTAVPLLSGWAIPGGPLAAETLAALKERLVAHLRRVGPVDGVYLALHGAMGAVGSADPEAELLRAVRAEVGPGVPLVVSYDLHAQLTAEKIAAADAVVAYRTNPHRDHAETGARAARLLIGAAKGKVKLTMAWRSLPLVIGGGTSIDVLPTMRPIFRWMKQAEREARVLDLSLCMCHLWRDSPEMGWGVVVVTDGDADLAERLADELAERAWAVKDVFPPPFLSMTEALRRIRGAWFRRLLGAACVCDTSDVVGCGAPGENTRVLSALLEHGKGLTAYVPLRDPSVTLALWDASPGSTHDVVLGGKLDPENCPALPVKGTFVRRYLHPVIGRMVLLDVEHARVVLTEGPPLNHKPDFFTCIGLSLWKADVMVMKGLFPFRLYYMLYNRMSLYVRTQGITDLDTFKRVKMNGPVHPLQALDDWRSEDRRRRGLPPTNTPA